MIEIRITIDAALTLLLERMKFELKVRQSEGIIKPGLKLENLSYEDLFKLTEASLFDTVFLLPVDLITSETNLVQVITQTVRALSKVLNREEFQLYTQRQAQKLIAPIKKIFVNINDNKNFFEN
ncbi:MAG: hypothetical protein AB1298_00370 [Bacteroidota bacterium]